MAIVLAALSLLGLGIFGPGIANGLVSGGPQLGAGAAVGTGLAAGGVAAGAALAGRDGGAAALPARAVGRRCARSAAPAAAVASAAFDSRSRPRRRRRDRRVLPLRGAARFASTPRRHSDSWRIRRAGRRSPRRMAHSMGTARRRAQTVRALTRPPAWAQPHEAARQAMSHGATAAAHAVRSGDSHGGGASVDLSEGERNDHVQTTLRPLRPHARARDALPDGRPGLGRAHRLGACPGQELAADGLRLA